jgi:hypothetical protein
VVDAEDGEARVVGGKARHGVEAAHEHALALANLLAVDIRQRKLVRHRGARTGQRLGLRLAAAADGLFSCRCAGVGGIRPRVEECLQRRARLVKKLVRLALGRVGFVLDRCRVSTARQQHACATFWMRAVAAASAAGSAAAKSLILNVFGMRKSRGA